MIQLNICAKANIKKNKQIAVDHFRNIPVTIILIRWERNNS